MGDLGGDVAGARAASHQRLVERLGLAQGAQGGGVIVQAFADVGGHLQQAHARIRRILQLGGRRLGHAGLDDGACLLRAARGQQVGGLGPRIVGLAVVVGEHGRHAAIQPGAGAFEVAGAQVGDGHQRGVVGQHSRRHAVLVAPDAFQQRGARRDEAQAVVGLGEVEHGHGERRPGAGGLGEIQRLLRELLRLGQVPQVGVAAAEVGQRVDLRPGRRAGLGRGERLVEIQQHVVVLAQQLARDRARVVADVEIGRAARHVGAARQDAQVQRQRLLQPALHVQVRGVELVAHQQAARVVVRGERGAGELVGLDGRRDAARAQQRQAHVEVGVAAQRVRGVVARGVERGLAQLAGAAAVDVELPFGLLEQARGIGRGIRTGQAERGGRRGDQG